MLFIIYHTSTSKQMCISNCCLFSHSRFSLCVEFYQLQYSISIFIRLCVCHYSHSILRKNRSAMQIVARWQSLITVRLNQKRTYLIIDIFTCAWGRNLGPRTLHAANSIYSRTNNNNAIDWMQRHAISLINNINKLLI